MTRRDKEFQEKYKDKKKINLLIATIGLLELLRTVTVENVITRVVTVEFERKMASTYRKR